MIMQAYFEMSTDYVPVNVCTFNRAGTIAEGKQDAALWLDSTFTSLRYKLGFILRL